MSWRQRLERCALVQQPVRNIPSEQEMNDSLLIIMRGINHQCFSLLGDKIVTGLFKGMVIPEVAPWDDGNASTKLLGAYEFELQKAVVRAIERKPEVVVNVGCAEGYYAIGLARLVPSLKVYAADIDQLSLDICEDYAKRNGVSVETVNGFKSAADMNSVGASEGLFVVDCEGAEIALLDKSACPGLVSCDIIVECHDFMNPTISSTLAKRFSDTHDVEVFWPQLPRLGEYPFLATSPTVMSLLTVTEKRPMPTLWLACWAKHKGA